MPLKTMLYPLLIIFSPIYIFAQGLTTTTLSGIISDENEQELDAATIQLLHVPSGTKYQTATQTNGGFYLPNLKVGGPYTLTIEHIGYQEKQIDHISLGLGQNKVLDIILNNKVVQLEEVVVKETSKNRNESFGSETYISKKEFQYLPNIGRSILDFTRLSPQAGIAGFAGKGARDNFVSIDGAAFNNIYGLGGNIALLVGNVVGAQPLSLDAIEAIQVKISPFDVSQGSFTGAGIHAITKSGNNEFKSSVYSYFRNEKLVGEKIERQTIPITDFNQQLFGISLGGPLIKNKLFYFINYERERRTDPGSNFVANRSSLTGKNVTRVKAEDLIELSNFLSTNYSYNTGPFEGYKKLTNNDKLLIKLDWNHSHKHQFSLRYNQLVANQGYPASNSASFGAGNRVDNLFSMTYQNSGGIRKVNAFSVVGEWNSFLGSRSTNRLIASYSYFPDSREINGTLFPTVDILKDDRTYISFGSHLFSTNNSIIQKNYHIQNDFSYYLGGHILTAGMTWDYFNFNYNFTPASAGSFVFDSVEDFYNSTSQNTSTPIGLSTGKGKPSAYARTYSALDDNHHSNVFPIFSQFGFYLKEAFHFKRLKIISGIRVDASSFPRVPMANQQVAELIFQDENGNAETFNTEELPSTTWQFSPRIGFNWQLSDKNPFQIRGGTGIFSGRTPFVRIGEQYINNGLLQGQIKAKGNKAANYSFSSEPNAYIPENPTAVTTYDLNITSKDFKMPQLWKSALGLDYDFPSNIRASIDLIYSNEISRDYVRNANLDHSDKGNSPDGRFVFKNSRLNNPPILGAYILDNTNLGEQFNASLQLKKRYAKNWMAFLAYTYGYAKDVNTFNASSGRIAYRSLPVKGNTNQPELAFSDDYQQHRVMSMLAYQIDYGGFGGTTFSVFLEGAKRGRFSYTYSGRGDINKDGIPSNDLIFVPANVNQIELETYNSNGQTISMEEQWQVLDNFINNSDYLSQRRGTFALRNGSSIPFFFQADLRILQEFHFLVSEKQNTLQISVDFINFTNLLNNNWGIKKLAANRQPIEARQNGKFRVNPAFLTEEYLTDTSLNSRWQLQLGVRYIL